MEPHFEKTRICREIKFVIVENVFSVSCVCFKEIFSVHYGKCIQLTQNETSDKHENSIFCEHHLRQSAFKCTVKRNLSQISAQKLSFSFVSKAIFYVFYLSKWTKTCNTTIAFKVALDVQSVKVSEYPFKENRSMLKKKTAIICIFLQHPLKDAQKKKCQNTTENLSKYTAVSEQLHTTCLYSYTGYRVGLSNISSS